MTAPPLGRIGRANAAPSLHFQGGGCLPRFLAGDLEAPSPLPHIPPWTEEKDISLPYEPGPSLVYLILCVILSLDYHLGGWVTTSGMIYKNVSSTHGPAHSYYKIVLLIQPTFYPPRQLAELLSKQHILHWFQVLTERQTQFDSLQIPGCT